MCSIEKAANESFGFGINRERGAVIHSVDQGSPADRANVKPNDIILYIDKQYVRKQKFEKVRDVIKRASQQTQKIELTLINPEGFKYWKSRKNRFRKLNQFAKKEDFEYYSSNAPRQASASPGRGN